MPDIATPSNNRIVTMLEQLIDPNFAGSVARLTTPILLAALGGAICERAGVFNIALEGFILLGAFMAVVGSYFGGSAYVGILTAMAGGVFLGLLFAEFHIRRKGDPIVISIALNLVGIGLSTYLLSAIFDVTGAFQDPKIIKIVTFSIPGIESLPFIGPMFREQSLLFFFSLFFVVFLHFFFKYHKVGLWLRAAGENPQGLLSLGVQPQRMRFLALVLCGILCGLAGAQLSISNVGLFVEGMSAGRGWIAVVVVLLTRGRPLPLVALVFLFGIVDGLSLRVQGFNWPQQFTEMLPYLAALAVLIFSSWLHRRKASKQGIVE